VRVPVWCVCVCVCVIPSAALQFSIDACHTPVRSSVERFGLASVLHRPRAARAREDDDWCPIVVIFVGHVSTG
jgi:hypothetical protein